MADDVRNAIADYQVGGYKAYIAVVSPNLGRFSYR